MVWAGVRTDRLAATAVFFREVMGLSPTSSRTTSSGSSESEHGHFTTGPVPSFHIDDVHSAVDELKQAGCEVFGPWGEPTQGWAHCRGPDGNVYGLSAGTEYRPSGRTRS